MLICAQTPNKLIIMKSILNLLSIFLILTTTCFAQVGIGIETPDASSILHLESDSAGLLLPRLTSAQRDAVITPAEGLTIYNTTTQSIEIYTDSWKRLTVEEETAPSLTMYRDLSGASIPSTSNSGNFDNFPLGISEVTEINSDYFEVVSNGKIKILKAGNYLINASWSTKNLEAGNTKYIFAIFKNGTRTGYMTRGFVDLLSIDYFGASGTFQHLFAANDIVDISYFIGNSASTLQGDLMHIGIVKL